MNKDKPTFNHKLPKLLEINRSVAETLSQPQIRGVFLAANGRNWLLDWDGE